ncbi:hypothetical protein A6R68_17688, partial [Neotoma lepida]
MSAKEARVALDQVAAASSRELCQRGGCCIPRFPEVLYDCHFANFVILFCSDSGINMQTQRTTITQTHFLLCFLLLSMLYGKSNAEEDFVVTTKAGRVRGLSLPV